MARQTIDLNIIPNWRGVTIKERQDVIDPKLPLNGIFGDPITELKRAGKPVNPDNIIELFRTESLLRFQVLSVDWVNLKAELATFGEVEGIDALALGFCFECEDWMEEGLLRSKLTGVMGAYFVLKAEQESVA